MASRPHRRRPLAVGASLGLACGLIFGPWSVLPDTAETGSKLAPQADLTRAPEPSADRLKRQRWLRIVQPRLARADRDARQAADRTVEALASFISQRQAGSRAMAEAVFSLRGKWALVKSKAPGFIGGDEQAHLRYLTQQFSGHLFSDTEIRETIESAVAAYLAELQAIENRLLVDIRADMADIPLDALPACASEAIFEQSFANMAGQMHPAVAQELGVDALREASGFLAGEIAISVLSAATARLSVSSGLLAAGAGTSWATFGLSLVAALVADQAVCWVIDETRDPVGELDMRIRAGLGHLFRAVVEGDPDQPGLRGQLSAYDQARAQVRREALRQLILGKSADLESVGVEPQTLAAAETGGQP